MNTPMPPIKDREPPTLVQALDTIEKLPQQLVELATENRKLKDKIVNKDRKPITSYKIRLKKITTNKW